MTREENLHWLNVEIRTWQNECQSKHPVKEALYAARKVLEQEPILEGRTLIVTTEHYENVGRVLVQYGTNGTLFYQDRQIDGVLEVLERYKLRMPPTVYDELVADIMNMDEQ